LNHRLALGETQAKLSTDAEAKLNEQIAARVKERNEKAKKEAEMLQLKKSKRHQELKEFYDQYVFFFLIMM
jgi:hypothetical protein